MPNVRDIKSADLQVFLFTSLRKINTFMKRKLVRVLTLNLIIGRRRVTHETFQV